MRGQRLSLMERVELARRTGYRALDFDYREVEEQLRAHPRQDAAAFWAEVGLEPGMAGGVAIPGPFAAETDFARALADVPAHAAAARRVGARQVGLVLPNRSRLPEAEARALVLQRLRRLGEALAPAGLRLAVEFIGVRTLWPELPHPFLQRYSEVLQLLEDTGHPHVGLLLDSYHCYGAEVPLQEIAQTPAARIVYLHINDAKPGPAAAIQDADRLLPGEGVIDLPGWLRAVAQTGFDGPIAPEVLGPRLQGMSSAQAAEDCYAAVADVMRRAGLRV